MQPCPTKEASRDLASLSNFDLTSHPFSAQLLGKVYTLEVCFILTSSAWPNPCLFSTLAAPQKLLKSFYQMTPIAEFNRYFQSHIRDLSERRTVPPFFLKHALPLASIMQNSPVFLPPLGLWLPSVICRFPPSNIKLEQQHRIQCQALLRTPNFPTREFTPWLRFLRS